MSIFVLALLGYLAGLVGSVCGGLFNVARVRNDEKERHSNDSRAVIIVTIVLYMIFTSKILQISKVVLAIIVAVLAHGSENAVVLTLGICSAFGFAFMALLPVVVKWRNRK